MGRDYIVATVAKAVKVEDLLANGDILAWKTAPEVAAATGLTRNEVFRILFTLEKCGRVERSDKGWRVGSSGLIAKAIYAQEYLANQAGKIGFRRMI